MPEKNKTIARIKSSYMQQYEAHQERQKRRRKRLFRRLSLFSLLVIIVFGSLTVYHVNQRAVYSEKKHEYEQLTEQLVDLETEEDSLKEEINLLNDEEYILDIARTNYFLSKEGELIFQIEDEDQAY